MTTTIAQYCERYNNYYEKSKQFFSIQLLKVYLRHDYNQPELSKKHFDHLSSPARFCTEFCTLLKTKIPDTDASMYFSPIQYKYLDRKLIENANDAHIKDETTDYFWYSKGRICSGEFTMNYETSRNHIKLSVGGKNPQFVKLDDNATLEQLVEKTVKIFEDKKKIYLSL